MCGTSMWGNRQTHYPRGVSAKTYRGLKTHILPLWWRGQNVHLIGTRWPPTQHTIPSSLWALPLRIETALSESNTKESLKTTEPLPLCLSFYTQQSLSPLLHYATVDICTCPNLQTDGIPTAFLIYISSCFANSFQLCYYRYYFVYFTLLLLCNM